MSEKTIHLLVAIALAASPLRAQPFVDGPKILWPAGAHGDPGSWSIGAAQQGFAVAASFDGSTAIVGAPYNDSSLGAAWIFGRNGGWSPQGAFLGASGVELGHSVAISSDGNTALVATPGGGGSVTVCTRSGGAWSSPQTLTGSGNWGSVNFLYVAISGDGATALVGTPTLNAAWAFARSGDTFSSQGELVPTACSNPSGAYCQGWSVALSSDGTTALVGGPGDASGLGATWVFTRSGSTWTQQGGKLVGTGNSGAAGQGNSVALSADGNTALVGGPGDDTGIGAAWVFTRSGSTWTQQGGKLVGTGGTRPSYEDQGSSVSLSADGSTALLGAPGEDNGGAAWVFTRTGGVWTQLGNKLVGTAGDGAAQERGFAVALSGDGRTALVGGPYDNAQVGAVWVFPRICLAAGDANGNGIADVSDVFYLINFLFAGGPAPVCR